MSRPQTEAEYLARQVPPSAAATVLGRRTLFKGALGAGAALSLPALLAACGGGSSGGSSGSGSKTVTFGSNQSDAAPKASYKALTDAFTAKSGIAVQTNTVDHETFQENINTYLQGTPQDVFTWFAGYRMRFFAAKGLAGDLSDVWGKLTGYTDAFKTASTGDDGKQYFVPISYYPWALFYRKSVFADKGYEIPTTLDEFTALSKQMQNDQLIPVAFADKQGWPAMGTFDVLNMRINGYQFHVDLMAGKKSWNGPEVAKVFDTWTGLLPYHQTAALGRDWEEAAKTLLNKKAGMYLLGLFVGQQFTGADLADLDFFTFPAIDSTIGSDALDAPIDGFMMAKKPKEEANAKELLSFFGSADGGTTLVKADPSTLAANSGADTSAYSALQKKSAELVGSAKSIAQFLDRDSRPDFASTVVIPALQEYIKDPSKASSVMDTLEAGKQRLFTS
jgi:multiple sugar transport system substrate-binding protein